MYVRVRTFVYDWFIMKYALNGSFICNDERSSFPLFWLVKQTVSVIEMLVALMVETVCLDVI